MTQMHKTGKQLVANLQSRFMLGAGKAIMDLTAAYGHVIPIPHWLIESEAELGEHATGLLLALAVDAPELEEGLFRTEEELEIWKELHSKPICHRSSRSPSMITNVPSVVGFLCHWLTQESSSIELENCSTKMVQGGNGEEAVELSLFDGKGNLSPSAVAAISAGDFAPRLKKKGASRSVSLTEAVDGLLQLDAGDTTISYEQCKSDGIKFRHACWSSQTKHPWKWAQEVIRPTDTQKQRKEAPTKKKEEDNGSKRKAKPTRAKGAEVATRPKPTFSHHFHPIGCTVTKDSVTKEVAKVFLSDGRACGLESITRDLDTGISRRAEEMLRLVNGRVFSEEMSRHGEPLTIDLFSPDAKGFIANGLALDVVQLVRGVCSLVKAKAGSSSEESNPATLMSQLESVESGDVDLLEVRNTIANICEHQLGFQEGADFIRDSLKRGGLPATPNPLRAQRPSQDDSSVPGCELVNDEAEECSNKEPFDGETAAEDNQEGPFDDDISSRQSIDEDERSVVGSYDGSPISQDDSDFVEEVSDYVSPIKGNRESSARGGGSRSSLGSNISSKAHSTNKTKRKFDKARNESSAKGGGSGSSLGSNSSSSAHSKEKTRLKKRKVDKARSESSAKGGGSGSSHGRKSSSSAHSKEKSSRKKTKRKNLDGLGDTSALHDTSSDDSDDSENSKDNVTLASLAGNPNSAGDKKKNVGKAPANIPAKKKKKKKDEKRRNKNPKLVAQNPVKQNAEAAEAAARVQVRQRMMRNKLVFGLTKTPPENRDTLDV